MLKKNNTKIKLLLIIILSYGCNSDSYSQPLTNNSGNFINYLKLPPGITKSELLLGTKKTKTTLNNYTRSFFNRQINDTFARNLDLIFVFTDQNGEPILPDKEIRRNQSRGSSILTNNEITFTFDSPDQPWSIPQLDSLNTFIKDFYPVIKKIIGNPLFNIIVNIRKDNSINVAGTYNASINELVLQRLVDHVFCHEIIHAFRDDCVIGLSTYEEGMTRAVEVEVFNQLQNYLHPNGEFHSYTYDSFYEGLNSPELATYNGNVFSNVAHVFLKYQLASYIWAKPYLEDNNFLKNFNDSLLSQTLSDPNTSFSESKLRNIFATVKPIVEGLTNSMWYERQFLLNTSPTKGYKLYQRVNQFTIDYFNRDDFSEFPQADAAVSWKILDANNDHIDSGSALTTSYGLVYHYPAIPAGYYGKIKLLAEVQSPNGLIIDSAYSIPQSYARGIFGIVEDVNVGSISITPLDTAMSTVTTNLTNGAFSIPIFENVRGRFLYVFSYPNNQRVSRIFTKDRSMYYLLIKNDPKTYWVGSIDNSWHNARNWSGGVVPGESSDVIINSANPFNCIIDNPAICRSLELSKDVLVTANNNLIILQ